MSDQVRSFTMQTPRDDIRWLKRHSDSSFLEISIGHLYYKRGCLCFSNAIAFMEQNGGCFVGHILFSMSTSTLKFY